MSKSINIIESAKKVIITESKAIANLANLIDKNFEEAVKLILNSKGRVIVTGIGKSANIATKIVSTFNSTGTPSVFMHAADSIHGDLGNIQPKDVVICISKSGETPEIKYLVPLIKNYGNKIIAITGNLNSYLCKFANFTINSYIKREACPNNLAPTSSTTAQLVIGDALAVCLQELKGFNQNDFAKYHPGGALGKLLYLKISDLVHNNQVPKINENDSFAKVVIEITEKRLGATAVLNNNKITGIVTDGDIRRVLLKTTEITKLTAKGIMGINPKIVKEDEMAINALQIMNNNNISQLLVTDNTGNYIGIVHLHDLTKEGISIEK